MQKSRRVLYVQYANPAGYPPLEHSSRILAGGGWHVLFLGVMSFGMEELRFPALEGVTVKRLGGKPTGWLLKLHYLAYALWVFYWVLRWRPSLLYVSDPLATPIAGALLAFGRKRVIYHEHDSPNVSRGFMNRLVAKCRTFVAQRADLCIAPNTDRLLAFTKSTGTSHEKTLCVWNCPSKHEVGVSLRKRTSADFFVYFHGSINETRLPRTVVQAIASLPSHVKLRFAGYETLGSQGYIQELVNFGRALGLEASRVEYLGAAANRSQIMEWARSSDVGLAFMPNHSDDINTRFMVGASNKAFDYMACGLPFLVTQLPEWVEFFVRPGYAIQCEPNDVQSIVSALRWLIENPARREQMGIAARERIQSEWNYERQFQPVLEVLDRL